MNGPTSQMTPMPTDPMSSFFVRITARAQPRAALERPRDLPRCHGAARRLQRVLDGPSNETRAKHQRRRVPRRVKQPAKRRDRDRSLDLMAMITGTVAETSENVGTASLLERMLA